MLSHLISLILVALLESSQAQGWMHITSDQLSNLPLSAFQGLTLGTLASVNVNACSGFRPEQVAVITPEAFAGWTLGCVINLSGRAFSKTYNNQIYNFPADAAAGLTANVIAHIPPSACYGFTETNIALMAYKTDGCSGFTSEQLRAMNIVAFPGWPSSCVSYFNPSIFSTMPATMMNAFSDQAYSGFTYQQIANLPDSVLLYNPLPRFAYFSAGGVSGISARQLKFLVDQHGTDFTNLLTNAQLCSYGTGNPTQILKFKALKNDPLYQAIPNNATWLQLFLTAAVPFTFNATIMDCSVIWGITPDQALLLDNATLIQIMEHCSNYLLPDTIKALDCSQIATLVQVVGPIIPESHAALSLQATVCGTSATKYSAFTGPGGISLGGLVGIVVGIVLVAVVVGIGALFIINRSHKRLRVAESCCEFEDGGLEGGHYL